MRDHNGDPVAPEDVLDQEELAAYYEAHPSRRGLPVGSWSEVVERG